MLFTWLLTNFLLLSSCSVNPGPYYAIVVDATTSKPLAGVTVQNLDSRATTTSDADGRITIAKAPVHLHLSRIGYAPLQVSRDGNSITQPDTLRLLLRELVLDNVVVRPTQQIRLTSVQEDARQKNLFGIMDARGMTPETKLAVLYLPPDTVTRYLVTKIVIGVPKQHEAEAGRLRVRLVNVESSPTPHPGANDLLPVAAIYSAAQVNNAPDHEISIDVSSYGLLLPKKGLCIVAECLPTGVNETLIGIDKVKSGNNLKIDVVTATDPKNNATYHRTPVSDFIWISVARSRAKAVTWRQGQTRGSWVQNFEPASSASKTAPTTNALMDLVVEPQ